MIVELHIAGPSDAHSESGGAVMRFVCGSELKRRRVEREGIAAVVGVRQIVAQVPTVDDSVVEDIEIGDIAEPFAS